MPLQSMVEFEARPQQQKNQALGNGLILGQAS